MPGDRDEVVVRRAGVLQGTLRVPGDKSISHRALIFGALASHELRVTGLGPGADVRSTAACLGALGVPIALDGTDATIGGVGLRGLRAPAGPLDCGNAGTTMRLLCGLLAGAGIPAELHGDASLSSRPMGRVLAPLRSLGAHVEGTDGRAPLRVSPARLHGGRVETAVASAQVKSALLLAGLFVDGPLEVIEPAPTRDHTERILRAAGVPLRDVAGGVRLEGPVARLELPARWSVPGDPSSAAFLAVAALLVPGGRVILPEVCVNPGRTGLLRALERMGAIVRRSDEGTCSGEPIATLTVEAGGPLRGVTIGADEIPSLVDEVPILAVLATQAHGRTEITGAAELRVKESDRLARMAQGLTALGARVEERPDGLVIDGPTPLRGARLDAAHDHRLAMAFAVAGLVADGETIVSGARWAEVSFPGFFAHLAALTQGAVQGPR